MIADTKDRCPGRTTIIKVRTAIAVRGSLIVVDLEMLFRSESVSDEVNDAVAGSAPLVLVKAGIAVLPDFVTANQDAQSKSAPPSS